MHPLLYKIDRTLDPKSAMDFTMTSNKPGALDETAAVASESRTLNQTIFTFDQTSSFIAQGKLTLSRVLSLHTLNQ